MTRAKLALVGVAALFLIAGIYLLQAQDHSSNYANRHVNQAGSAKLVNGSIEVKFEEGLFAKAANIRIVASPVGSWSGIFIKDISNAGFTAMSETGNLNAEFNWIAVGEIKEPPMSIYRDAIPQTNE